MRLCKGDQEGTDSRSASASRIASRGASINTSRDARTATQPRVVTVQRLRKRTFFPGVQLTGYQPISSSGVVWFGGGPNSVTDVRENRGAGEAWSNPFRCTIVERARRCSPCAASVHVNTGVVHASVPAKISVHSSRVLLANFSVKILRI